MKSIFKSLTMGGVSMGTVGILLSSGVTDVLKGNLITVFSEDSKVVLVVGPWLDLAKRVGVATSATGVVTAAIGTVKRTDIYTPKWFWGNNKPDDEDTGSQDVMPEQDAKEMISTVKPNNKWDF